MAENESITREAAWLLKEKYSGLQTPEYEADLARLRSGVPLAYLIGHVPFLNATIHLDTHPLIPRAETEYWVERAVEETTERLGANTTMRILDLCAGSGCIGVAFLKAFPNAHVDFAERDERHHPTIRKNVTENGIDLARSSIFGGDLFEHATGVYDLILSNPPYIDPERGERVEKSVLAHEPHDALWGGRGGFDIIRKILEGTPAHLAPSGRLYIEHEPEQAADVRRSAASAGLQAVETRPDQYGVIRMSVLSL